MSGIGSHANKAYIVAEVGSNFFDLESCIESIHAAKASGANAVKFQLFTKKDMYGFGETDLGVSPYLHPCWLPRLYEAAQKVQIDFLCTAFSSEGLSLVDPYVNMHKIASSDLTHIELLDAVNKTMKPVVLSMGGSTGAEISQALTRFNLDQDITLCYCVSSYPTHQYNLFAIEKLRKLFGKRCSMGLSDHSLDLYPAISAVRHFGVKLIEKHFTLKKNMGTPDALHSLSPTEFQKMVELINEPNNIYMPDLLEELDMILKYKRRLVAIRHIEPGQLLKLNDNYGSYRSVIADESFISGFEAYDLDGKKAARNILPGYPIQRDDYI